MSLLQTAASNGDEPVITDKLFGEFQGNPVTLYTLENAQGMKAEISNFGGIVVRLLTPDRHGKLGDVVLGYDDFASYEKDAGYYGAITGRNANRIAEGTFELDGQTYSLAQNNGKHNIHGGKAGFNKKLWKGTPSVVNNEPTLTLTYTSRDGEEGFPGTLKLTTVYTLTSDNSLTIQYKATTDHPTICNLTHHGYWNLGGPDSDSILQHELQFFCDAFTPTDETAIPTGEIRSVAGTPFDFRTLHTIGERINADDEQIQIGHGYDHNFVINGKAGTLRPVATVYEPTSGRVMEMLSTDHGVQFYSGNWFDGSVIGKNNKSYTDRIAFCLECQKFPDAPNQPDFPSSFLRPGNTYEKTTAYRFSVRDD